MTPSYCMFLAEGSSLDGLVMAVQLIFVSTALPGLCGFFLLRLRGVAIFLGAMSMLAGIGLLSWMFREHSTQPSFYVAAATPLLMGVATCLRACFPRRKTAPLPVGIRR